MSGMKHGLLAIGEVMARSGPKVMRDLRSVLPATATTRPSMRHAKSGCLARLPISPVSAASRFPQLLSNRPPTRALMSAMWRSIRTAISGSIRSRPTRMANEAFTTGGQSRRRGGCSRPRRREFMPDADIIYLSGITLAILTSTARHRLVEVLISRRSAGAKIAFDQFRPKLWENAPQRAERRRPVGHHRHCPAIGR